MCLTSPILTAAAYDLREAVGPPHSGGNPQPSARPSKSQRQPPNPRPLRSRIKMTCGSRSLTSNVQGQRESQVKCPSRCFRHYAKTLKTLNPESHAKMSGDRAREYTFRQWNRHYARLRTSPVSP